MVNLTLNYNFVIFGTSGMVFKLLVRAKSCAQLLSIALLFKSNDEVKNDNHEFSFHSPTVCTCRLNFNFLFLIITVKNTDGYDLITILRLPYSENYRRREIETRWARVWRGGGAD